MREAHKFKGLLFLCDIEYKLVCWLLTGGFQAQRQVLSLIVQQCNTQWNVECRLVCTFGSWRAALPHGEAVEFTVCIIGTRDTQHRCAGVTVPAPELRKIDAAGVFHGFHKIFGRNCLTVVTLEVQIRASTEHLRPQQLTYHTHYFCAFFVNGQRIKIGDLHIGVGSHRMGHRAGIFSKLQGTQEADILDPFDRPRSHVC